MEALVYYVPGKQEWEEKPKLSFKNTTETIIRVTKTTESEIDIQITNRDVPEVMKNFILAHEGVVAISEPESGVSILNVVNKALIKYHIRRKS